MERPHPKSELRVLSLGAGVQSTTLLLLAAEGVIPRFDLAVFADTQWEPRKVYEHLDRIERDVAGPAGIPIIRVTSGNIRRDALDPRHRFASMPLFIKNPDGGEGMTRRQCSSEYKLKPIKAEVRRQLGAPRYADGRIGQPRRGRFVDQAIGFSTDEIGRVRGSGVQYSRNHFPLLDLGMSRRDCQRYLESVGFGDTPKSACLGCPFHGNRQWRRMRDETPDEWADAVAFDQAIRQGNARGNANGHSLLGKAYLHRSRLPLDQAPIDHITAHEQRQDAEDERARLLEEGDPDGCSPWGCRSGLPEPTPARVRRPLFGTAPRDARGRSRDGQRDCSASSRASKGQRGNPA